MPVRDYIGKKSLFVEFARQALNQVKLSASVEAGSIGQDVACDFAQAIRVFQADITPFDRQQA